MRKMVLVTKGASSEILTKFYLDAEIVGLDEGIFLAREAGARISLALSSFKTVRLEDLLGFLSKDKILRYQEDEEEEKNYSKIVDFLFTKGAEELVILDKTGGTLLHVHSLLKLLKDSKGLVSLQDEDNYISYYPEGVHVITRQGFKKFSIFGYPEADISLEHVSKPIKNMHLSFADSPALEDSILERVAVLKVNKGGVLLALSDQDD
jgi:thiamine pyrophosphokinase